ncbi:hypothetical protein, partial [Burkholderia sola]|uniref:hypothetical protein n=1 Tax=Burkholderia sola TaxID=2843302 RepID=UPI00338F7869
CGDPAGGQVNFFFFSATKKAEEPSFESRNRVSRYGNAENEKKKFTCPPAGSPHTLGDRTRAGGRR